jgi:hypothetical protein
MIAVSQENVEKALDEIDKGGGFGVPRKRRSTQYCLVARGRHYPPKYVLVRAYTMQTGTKPQGLTGGPMTNIPLQDIGYTILLDNCGNTCNFSD